MPSQREVEICHDVTFDEDASLRKVVNLLSSEEDHEARLGNQEEQKDETKIGRASCRERVSSPV